MENYNGDVVVFDVGLYMFGVIVVVDYEGKYCFFYQLELVFQLFGICINLMFYILVCDIFNCLI